MCGICGILPSGSSGPLDIDRAVAALHHRGPDASGIWRDEETGLAFGHTRLAIIDLSEAGAQPMISSDQRLVLSYNGELYNFERLRDRLVASGSTFRGRSDTEVLLEAFSCWGVRKALEAADGMFAFALWDRTSRQLTLGRDRMGEKPLYYGQVGGSFVFASELDAIRAMPGFSNAIDRDALTLLLRHKYIPAPHCIYEGLQKLPPATTVTVGADGVVGDPEPYWRLSDHLDRTGAIDDATAIDRLAELVMTSVSERMVADVPVGAFLSGGLDSTLVTAAMAATGREVKTFTIGLADVGFDESPHARAVAEHLGTNHTELEVSASMALEVVAQLSEIYDEPFADSSQIPTFLVSQLAREHVTVALSGDGGDELFGGYNRHRWVPSLLERNRRVPAPVRGFAGRALSSIPQRWYDQVGQVVPANRRPRMLGLKAHKAAQTLKEDDAAGMLLRLTSHWGDPAAVVLGGTEPSSLLTSPEDWPSCGDPSVQLMTVDALTYLPDDILVKLDRASMAVSLESRVPLLATDIVEFAAGLPAELRIRDGKTKWLMRELLDRWVPRELMERPKAGFGIPIGDWLRSELRPWAEDLLAPDRLRAEGFFDPTPITACWERHKSGSNGEEFKLWDVLMFQAWLERHH